MNTELTRQLRGDEDVRAQAYTDSLGYLTIGIGRLIDARKPGSGLRPIEMDFMLANDIDERTVALTKLLPWLYLLDSPRQGVLLNMSFQLGVEGLMGFKNTLELIRKGQFAAAADGMLQSKWAVQTPARAGRLAEQMRTGAWQFSKGT